MLFRFYTILTVFLCSLSSYAASGLKDVELRDLYFGEVLYYAYQDLHFDALARLDAELTQYHNIDESELDPFHQHATQAEFSVGDLELQYRMSKRAGKAIQAVLGEGVDLATRNMAAYQLARVFYKKGDPQSTLYALDLIKDEVDRSHYEKQYSFDQFRGKEKETFKTDVAYLRAQASIETGQFSEAVALLQPLKNEESLEGYAAYNLGLALILSGKEEEGVVVLDELGRLETGDNDLLAIKDKTNLKLAYLFLDKKNADRARKYFERVRLDGPYSNRALLGAGWVLVAKDQFDRALVPWSILHKREVTNVSVQEALMSVPYAYGKSDAHGKAANLYSYAMDVFANEITSMDESIKSIRTGKFLAALLNEKSSKDKNWVVNLREMPDTPETRYILELMASHDFQESYKNYKDLADLRHHSEKWLADLRVYEEMIDIRRAYQEPLLPVVEEQFKKIDARVKLRLEQRENLATKLKNMLIAPRPEYLATSSERHALDTITAFDERVATNPQSVSEDAVRRMNRLRGILLWRVHSEYDQRLTDAYNNLMALDEIIVKLKVTLNSFIRTRQAATQSYEGYTIPIRQLRTRLFEAKRKLKGVMAKQGRMLETMAINELDRRRKRLEDYQIKARFALAESYDRATKSQLDAEVAEQKAKIEEQKINQEGQALDNKPEAGNTEVVPESDLPAEDVPVNDEPVDAEPVDAEPTSDAPVDTGSSFKDKLQSR